MATASPIQPYHSSYQQVLPDDPETVALKRTYLSLLTNQQVTDICITLDLYAPTHIRNSVWPYDLKATIAILLANQTKPAPSEKPTQDDEPKPTDGSDQTANGSEPPPMASLGHPPPQKPHLEAQDHTQQSQSHPQPNLPPPPPAQHYPHPSPQVPPYPHAPYYGHGQYHPPSMPGFLPPPMHYGTMYTRPPVTRPDGSTEDLPSYEEMIVNALMEHPDPEGAPPKDLFAWMAARYPLQTNFRPSASQALQKAFKRGRLEKGPGGKYRLNASWEGGSTSRRTTRRPLTHQVVVPPPHQPSPFTQIPLPPHGQFNYQHPGYPGQQHKLEHAPLNQDTSAASTVIDESGEGSDAWEAAQNILKALNFGGLLQQVEQQAQQAAAVEKTPVETCLDVTPIKDERAALQSDLVLLAAQLAEVSERGDAG
ncbi:hypothetical protein BJ322DRAFT_477513 [Thelephora terrestris]|uniref:Histone H1 n=1 Tax=Thelephora terrestris TaxID=56493 RepID=A0A9P6H4A8_9AGAM|nr:hypothetical protein BJ322DRAFT_477513 [Thelephora terrestris]